MFKTTQRPTNRPSNPREREKLDFRFSNFQALQVPKGWDRLFVSVIYVETGKTIAKLGKALVKNGGCQWTETLSKPIYISRDDSSKGYDECLVKILVSTGSTRSSTLGEATINMANYTSSRASPAVSLPLKKCSYGTVLQVKIQCLTPRSKNCDVESRTSNPQEKNRIVVHYDTSSKSYGSDNSTDSTVKREDLASTSSPLKLHSREASESASSSGTVIVHSSEDYDSHERRQIPDYDSIDNVSPSNQSSSNSRRDDFRNEEAVVNRSSLSNLGSSRNLLEAAEDTIDELRAETKMWERNARKLMIDLDISRKEFSDLSKKQSELVMELSASRAEHDGLERDTEKLKLDLQKLATNQATKEDSVVESEGLVQIQKVLENEIKYQQDLNNSLGQQLRQSQDSNIELVSVLQELEETIEKQRIEIENLSSIKLEFSDLQNSIDRDSEDKRNLLIQLQQLKESEMKLQGDIQLLEEGLRVKSDELENERKSNREILLGFEEDYKKKISVKEDEIAHLEATLSGYENNVDFVREIESLRDKVQELEKDCDELTDENLELLFKLKDSNKTDHIRKCASFDSMSGDHLNVCPSDESEVSDPKFQIFSHFESPENFTEISKQLDTAFHLLMKPWYGASSDESETSDDCFMIARKGNTTTNNMSDQCIVSFLQELNKLLEKRIAESDKILRNHEVEISEKNQVISDANKTMGNSMLKVQELEVSKARMEEIYANLMKELDQKISEFDIIEAHLLSKEQETSFCLQHQRELEEEVSKLQQKKSDLEDTLSGLQDENMQLEEFISGLEIKVRQLKDEKEFHLNEMNNFKSVALSFEDEIHKLKFEMEIQILVIKQKSEDMQNQWLGAQEECECLKEENKTLRERVPFEASSEVKLKAELTKEKLDLAQQEYELKIEDLTGELDASKQSHDRLMVDNERTLKFLAYYRKSEEKLKTELNEIELKHTISEYQSQQLTKEMGILKVQLQNISGLQNEISILKSELKECKIDKGKLELQLQTISKGCDKLKMENISLSEKICIFEDAVSEFEECKRNKLALEEKVLKMEKELTAKEILCTDVKNELTELKRANTRIQQEMYRLEEEKGKCLKKAQVLEEDLKLMEERNNILKMDAYDHNFLDESPLAVSSDHVTESHTSSNYDIASKKPSKVVARERYERTKSSLETELRDLKERYLEMSLKYAEVESQREDLVMRLKTNRGGRRWFA